MALTMVTALALVFATGLPLQEPSGLLQEGPDTIPAWVYADSNISAGSAHIAFPFVKRIVTVAFKRNATPLERQTAVAAVAGRVVARRGMVGGDGVYFVEIVDPGDGSKLLAALHSLKGIEQVYWAAPEYSIEPKHWNLPTNPPRPPRNSWVPDSALDRVPDWVMADSNIKSGSPLIGGEFVGRILVVRFQRGASVAQKTVAIEAVSGAVVGGRPMPGAEGTYLVRIEDPGDASQLLRVSSKLREMPQVSDAGIDIIMHLQ